MLLLLFFHIDIDWYSKRIVEIYVTSMVDIRYIYLCMFSSVYRFSKVYITSENFYKTLIFFYGMFFVGLDFSWKKFSCMSWWNFYVQHIIPNRKRLISAEKKEKKENVLIFEIKEVCTENKKCKSILMRLRTHWEIKATTRSTNSKKLQNS